MDYLLSVIFITYNHEKYVERAIRSVLAQETDFPFEIIVGDDVSTDSTRKILDEIAKDYPEHEAKGPGDKQIRFVERDKNTGRPTLNVYETTQMCKGDYLAYLEGDDYWTDVHKLQKQVDMLKNHPEYIAVTHNCVMVDENSDEIKDADTLKIGDLYKWDGLFTINDFCYSGKWAGHYATVVSRNIYKNNINGYDYTILYRAHDFVDDAVLLLFLLMQGDIFRMNEDMSVWRYVKKSGGTNWNSLALNRDLARDDCYLEKTLIKWVEETKGLSDYCRLKCKNDFGLALKMYLKKPNKENKKFLQDMYEYGITHVVLEDRKSSLLGYSIKTIVAKLVGK